jgi:branched-chain amino acid transport system substrate-binding protein
MGASLLGLTLVAAACGGSGGDGSTTAATVDSNVRSGIQNALGGSSTTGGAAATVQPTTMEGWEALWAEQRAAIVKRIKDNKWGKTADGTRVVGPEGFAIDLTKCPAGWSDTEGVTDTNIKIGHPAALSGPQADYGNIPKAADALMKYYSSKGIFKDSNGKTRTATIVMRDDGFDPARTIPLVDELIDSEKVFAVATMSSAGSLKTYDKLNQRCIPQPTTGTGHPGMADPVNHPWTTIGNFAYTTEAVLWGAFIEQHLSEFGGKVKVAALVTTNDFGAAYDTGFKAFLAQSPQKANIQYVTESVEPLSVSVKDQMTTLASQKPDVFLGMNVAATCSQVINEAAENGLKEQAKYKFISSVCKAASFVGKDKVGDASDGWWTMGGGLKDINSTAFDDDAFVKFGRQIINEAGYDYTKSGSFGFGLLYFWPWAQALQIAGELEGGLTRTNLIVAFRAMDMTHPFLLSGVKYNLNGNKDAYAVEGSDISKWDTAKQTWVQQGTPIDISGQSKNCAFNQASGRCE